MHFAQLGKTDLVVSRICFGCWQLSPSFWGKIPLEPWHAALKKALDLGVNFIDTADAYGDGYAESSLGEFLHKEGLRDRFIVATKFFWDFTVSPRVPNTTHDYILRACEDSLRRLKTDRIDLYQIHAWDPLTRPEEVAAAFGRLKKEGKVRWFGVSNQNLEQIRLYGKHFEVASLQPHYNLLFRDIEARELPYCLESRIGVIPYSPLYRGLLAGTYSRDQEFEDHRGKLELFTGEKFQRILDGLDEIGPIAQGLGLTVSQLAIRWVLTHPAITSAIVGIKTPGHIESIVPAAEGVLPRDVWHKVAGVMEKAKG
ncbi:MAG: aldo/keto reductase [Candidatus Omnitrophica bacterium]|nr:aldo/keto reductase [Candidatus Omnitrophota bacterium]